MAQSTLHFTLLRHHLKFSGNHPTMMLQLMCEGCSYTYPPLSIAMYSFIQLNELEQCRVKKLVHSFNTAAQDSNPGSFSQEAKALLEPLRLSMYAHMYAHTYTKTRVCSGHVCDYEVLDIVMMMMLKYYQSI